MNFSVAVRETVSPVPTAIDGLPGLLFSHYNGSRRVGELIERTLVDNFKLVGRLSKLLFVAQILTGINTALQRLIQISRHLVKVSWKLRLVRFGVLMKGKHPD